jgi:hypothetical protein
MKVFSLSKPMSKEYFDIWTKKFNPSIADNNHPQEDFVLVSQKYPIFVVADGVTLKRDKEGRYPNPSGSAELAQIFCQTIIHEAEQKYETFSELDLRKLFSLGNREAGAYNVSMGRTEDKIDYREFDLFAATTAFVLIKDNKMFWWSLADAGIKVIDKEGALIFKSPLPNPYDKKYLPNNWDELNETEKNKSSKRIYRNTVSESGELIGYGVVTGEDGVINYLNSGSRDIESGQTILLYTDGFENYFKQGAFASIFISWPQDLQERVENISNKLIHNDPQGYGQERSLIAIQY